MEEDIAINPSLALQRSPIKMRPGEYQLHILVETSIQLKSPKVDNDITALICCTAFGKKEYSSRRKGVGREQVNWGQHFYFNYQFTNVREALGAKLLITVFNFNLLKSNSEIGSWEMDIYKIYEMEGHTMQHQWIGLSSAINDFREVKGYLKISASLTGEHDKTAPLRPETIATITDDRKIMIPPTIALRSFEIAIKIFAARDLKPCDGNTADAYVSVQFLNHLQKTLAVRRTSNPTFNKIIYMPIWLPALTDTLTIRLVDHNEFISDEIMGSFYPTFNDIFSRKYAIPRWINFYGPQLEGGGKNFVLHTMYPELATYYTGTVLMSITITECDGPRKSLEPLEEEYEPPKMILYRLALEIHCAVNLFEKTRMCKVKVKFGIHEIDTAFVRSRNGFAGWFLRKNIVLRAFANAELPDLFVYIVNEDNLKTCYLRFPVKVNERFPAQFISLFPDMAVQQISPEQAGIMKFGFELTLAPKMEPPVENIFSSPLNIPDNVRVPQGRIVCNLFNAIELAPRDTEGTSDPFVVVSYFDQIQRSILKEETLNASFYENIVLSTVLFAETESPPIVVSVFDQDNVSRELIGGFTMSLTSGMMQKCIGVSGKEVVPIWIPIYNSGVYCGKLLLSFQIYYHTALPQSIPKTIGVGLRKFLIQGFVMSIDDLQIWGPFNFHKPFLEFDYKNINPPGTTTVQNYFTPPGDVREKGIQVKLVHKAVVLLPQSTAYWTQLGVRLKDQILGAMYQPLIGYFSINLVEMYQRSRLFTKFLRKKVQSNRLPSPQQYNSLKYSSIQVERLKGLHRSIIVSFSRFILQGLNYNWNFLGPTTSLNSTEQRKEYVPELVVVFPSYGESITRVYIEKYKNLIDSNSEYISVGYDKVHEKSTKNIERRNKHYRFALKQPLKQFYRKYYNAEVGISSNVEIHTGKKLMGDDLLTSLLKWVAVEDTYRGLFKGEFLVQEYKDPAEMTSLQREIEEVRVSRIRRRIVGCKVYVFLYVIDCRNLPSKDTFSPSDAYLKVSIGNQTQDNASRFVSDDANPRFFQKFKFMVALPAESILTVEVWDQDDIDRDDLIGYVKIDVENRFWQNQNQVTTCNPIQTWQLKCDTSKLSQGDIRFWLDIVPMEMIDLYKEFDITPKPKKKFQIRVIVWGCDNIPPNNFQKMSDYYVACQFNGEVHRTDTHWRSMSGDGEFNWRILFDVELPIEDPLLSFKVYDKDLLQQDEYKASTSFSIASYLESAFDNEMGGYLYLGTSDLSRSSEVPFCGSKLVNGQVMYNRALIELISPHNNSPDEETLIVHKPRVDITIQILTQQEAMAKPAGRGREHPNVNPTLPEPTGRFDFGFNPWNLLGKLCGRRNRIKALLYCSIFFLVLTVYLLVVSMLGGIIANAIN